MFSKDKGSKDKNLGSSQPSDDSSAGFESNLQPIDMSVFDKTSQQTPGAPAVGFASDDTGDAQPLGDRIDMAAVASLNTSQFLASAVGAAAGSSAASDANRDPFAPSDAAVNPNQDAEGLGDTASSQPLADDKELDAPADKDVAAAAGDAADTGAASAASDVAVLQDGAGGVQEDAAAYSRDNASYEHRRGWRALSTVKKVAIVVIILLALACGVAGGAVLAFWQNAQEDAQIQDEGLTEVLEPVEETIDPYWMLILGSDSRAEASDRARSDVIMLCRIDPETPRVTMVSIPRDTKVEIDGYGTQKINAAYALGGRKLAVKTVSKYAGVKISHYAEIYFSGLEDLVDQLGGVTVNVPEYVNYSDVTLQPGKQELNGHEALIFARCRKTYTQGDFTRTKCQRILVKAMVEKVLAQPATKIPGILEKATKCFSTDLALEDLVTLATKMQSIGSDGFYSGMCPSTTGMVDGVSYTFSYVNQWKLLMQKADAGEKPKLTKKEIEICGYTATNTADLDMKSGLPSDVQTALEEYWAKKEAKAQAKKKKELAAQNVSSNVGGSDTSGSDASTDSDSQETQESSGN